MDLGIIDRVIRPLMSGKEAQVWLVEAAGERRVAKIYKEASQRSFRHRASYTEGRRVRDSRQQRAMDRKSKFGRSQLESAWKSAEVDAIYRLRDAGVRVPTPYDFVEGVLVMSLVADPNGEPAPRLCDVTLTRSEAREVFDILVREVVKMLCAGLVHGDLSDFNVLLAAEGPVIIDFPQAIEAAANRNAERLLVRDVKNLTRFLGRWDRRLRRTRYGDEIWDLYQRGVLTPDTPLTGRFERKSAGTDVDAIIAEIQASAREEARRREALGLPPPRPARKPVAPPQRAAERPSQDEPKKKRRRRRRKKKKPETAPTPAPERAPASPLDDIDRFLVIDDD